MASTGGGQMQDPNGTWTNFFPGPTYLGPLPGEEAAWQGIGDYMAGPYQDIFQGSMGGLSKLMSGGASGGMFDLLNPFMGANLAADFNPLTRANSIGDRGTYDVGWLPSYQDTSIGWRPQQLNLGFQTPDIASAAQGVDISGYLKQFMPGAVGADTGTSFNFDRPVNQAMRSMLGGQPDFGMVDAMTKAVTRPTLDILQQDIMPNLRAMTNQTYNPTGEIKDTNRIVPRVMQDITDTAQQLTWQERMRASDAQQAATGMGIQGLLGQSGQGLQGYQSAIQAALGQGGLDAGTQQLLASALGQEGQLGLGAAQSQLGADQFRQGMIGDILTGNAQRALQSGMFQQGTIADILTGNAGRALQGDTAQQNVYDTWRQQTLGLLGLGQEAGQAGSNDIFKALGLAPQVAQMGEYPYRTALDYASNFQRPLMEAGLGDAMDRWGFENTQPQGMLDWYNQYLNGTGALGQTVNGPSPNRALGALGGAATGAGLGSMMGMAAQPGLGMAAMSNPYTMWLALLGGALGAFG